MSPNEAVDLPLAMVQVNSLSGIGWLFTLIDSRMYFPQHMKKKVDLARLTKNLVQSICCNISIERSCHVEFEYLHILSVVNMTKTLNEKV